jgi:hypothetical protein
MDKVTDFYEADPTRLLPVFTGEPNKLYSDALTILFHIFCRNSSSP